MALLCLVVGYFLLNSNSNLNMSVERLRRQRGHARGQVTIIYDNVKSRLRDMSREDILMALSKLEKLQGDLGDLDEKIGQLEWTAELAEVEDYKNLDVCEQYSDKIISSRTYLQCALERFDDPAPVDNSGGQSPRPTPVNKPKLPVISLPKYSHDRGELLSEFFSSFEDILDKYTLTDYEKFLYLQAQLSGEPRIIIGALQGQKQSYPQAKSLLESAFADTVSQKYDALGRLTKLHLDDDCNVYEFVSEMTMICDLIPKLSIDVDMVLQYFVWNSMPVRLQSQFVNICNTNKPDLKEIKDNMFRAIDRYNELKTYDKSRKSPKGGKAEPTIQNFATAVSYDKLGGSVRPPFCSLCAPAGDPNSHSTRDCGKYPTARAKLDQLEALKSCCKCGFSNHSTEFCKFKFQKPCLHCNEFHMNFLCPRQSRSSRSPPQEDSSKRNNVQNSKPKGNGNKNRASTHSHVVWTEHALSSNYGSDDILPTFTFKVNGTNVRTMRDSGSQKNFLDMNLATQLGLRVLKDKIPVTVNGFNGSYVYDSRIVEVPLRLGEEFRYVEAFCVPEIKINLSLPGLSDVVREFNRKRYPLADIFLTTSSNQICDVKFMLGTVDFDMLTEQQVKVGSPKASLYSVTALGVMLYGSVDRWLQNLPELPGNSHISACLAVPNVATAEVHPELETGRSEHNCSEPVVSCSQVVLDENSNLEESLNKATKEILDCCNITLNYDQSSYNEEDCEIHNDIVNYVLSNTERDADGRVVMPLPWRSDTAHRLGSNFELAKQVLRSSTERLNKCPMKLKLIDDVFKEQERLGIIERVENVESFLLEHPEHSFLAHMPVFRPEKPSTPVRVVYLSNLCQKSNNNSIALSHNQAIHAGPCYNHKIQTACTMLRFGGCLLVWDLVKAFLSISLNNQDSNKLLFLWYNKYDAEDKKLIVYKSKRVAFGLPASPMLLMLCLWKILVLDTSGDDPEIQNIKRVIYALSYMDNCAFTGSPAEVKYVYSQLEEIFAPYKFAIQQVCSNEPSIQANADLESGEGTPNIVKVLGLNWNKANDTFFPNPIQLDVGASTKRSILRSIASQYDVLNIHGPCLNRARLFLHRLQCDQKLGWDSKLDDGLCSEWKLIAVQANKTPAVEVERSFGERDDPYELISFCDASKSIYATVLYLKNLRTNNVSFLCGKNRIVNRQLETKTIPNLELQAVSFGVEVLIEVKAELDGKNQVCPIKIASLKLFTDSLITLNWLKSYTLNFAKMKNVSVFAKNRLAYIQRKCQANPVEFNFVGTHSNPSDCLTRPVSYKQLSKSCYLKGPDFLRDGSLVPVPDYCVTVPDTSEYTGSFSVEVPTCSAVVESEHSFSEVIKVENFSSWTRLVGTLAHVLKFIKLLRDRVQVRKLGAVEPERSPCNFYEISRQKLIEDDQRKYFSEIFAYYRNSRCPARDIPSMVSKLNVFVSDDGLLKVKTKFDRWSDYPNYSFPILMSDKSHLTKLLISNIHGDLAHGGTYNVLSVLRKQFWVPSIYSTVKKILKACVSCRRFNARNVKLNTNSYRPFRAEPPSQCYKYLFCDYMGPINIKYGEKKLKIWILCFTCLWSRSVNLKICPDLTAKGFLRAFQMHVFEWGLPSKVFSDLGSQIVASANLVSDFLASVEMSRFLDFKGIKAVKFEQYFKGNSALGSLVEVMVKFTKRLLYGAIRNNVLCIADFEFIVSQTIHLLNKRPLVFQQGLRDMDSDIIPAPITPELLLKGRDLPTVDVIPALEPVDECDDLWSPSLGPKERLRYEFKKLRESNERLVELYNEEFSALLVSQAADRERRYAPVMHRKLCVGDVVLLREPHMKAYDFPKAIVQQVVVNSKGEVTDIVARKGRTRESVKRHVSSVIPFLSTEDVSPASESDVDQDTSESGSRVRKKPMRRAAKAAKDQISRHFS